MLRTIETDIVRRSSAISIVLQLHNTTSYYIENDIFRRSSAIPGVALSLHKSLDPKHEVTTLKT